MKIGCRQTPILYYIKLQKSSRNIGQKKKNKIS
jgi:hypothetical protein